ncbi:hypothetical protein [Nocardiopsis aegyptia]|uniref:Uncharacterized protein n=1 Tax=Nocardiopsis aegyptia TaxID=220378 RepID=A0A7Z0EJT9_9ACTN|nr:hypothetical protein [Nocardiopsis aegyptia]NYJ33410.1 hypothetical protein [Nocardiopsis aegyptia]
MSFDLAFWRADGPLTAQDAQQVYQVLCHGGGNVPAHPAVDAFHADLLARYPVPGRDDGRSPWSVRPWHTDECVLGCMPYSEADAMAPVLLDLARRHGLTCYDPQSGTVHFPRNANTLTLRLYEDVVVHGPAPEDVRWVLERIGARAWFAILEDEAGGFVQTATGPAAPEGSFAVEYRDGEQYQALVDDLARVLPVFEGFLRGDRAWRTTLDFTVLGL